MQSSFQLTFVVYWCTDPTWTLTHRRRSYTELLCAILNPLITTKRSGKPLNGPQIIPYLIWLCVSIAMFLTVSSLFLMTFSHLTRGLVRSASSMSMISRLYFPQIVRGTWLPMVSQLLVCFRCWATNLHQRVQNTFVTSIRATPQLT